MSRLTPNRIEAIVSALPPSERQEARILLACKLIRSEIRGIRCALATDHAQPAAEPTEEP